MKVFSLNQHIQVWSWLFKIVFYSGLIIGCYMAFAPVQGGIQAEFNDKALHALGFFLMALSSQLAHPRVSFYVLASGLTCFGFVIELVQAYLPYRSFSLLDWGADILGVAIYFIFFGRFLKDKSALD